MVSVFSVVVDVVVLVDVVESPVRGAPLGWPATLTFA